MKVELVDHMGTDLSVVNAARVSFSKIAEEFTEKDTKLINYLAKHNHWTPFAHTSISLRVSAPIFVARQLGKHQVGLVWNEVSRRYVDDEPTFFTPDTWRKRADNVKQGSSDEPVNMVSVHVDSEEQSYEVDLSYSYRMCIKGSFNIYTEMLRAGVAPEQARMVLPQSMYTEWIWTGSLVAFARVCKLRLDPHTQKETQVIAEQIAGVCHELFPVSFKALMEG